MRLHISHSTSYHYPGSVPYGLTQIRLTPTSSPAQDVIQWNTQITGGHRHVSFVDHHSNIVELVGTDPDTHDIEITVDGEVETIDTHGVLSTHTGLAPQWLFRRETALTTAGPAVRSLTKGLDPNDDPIATVHQLAGRVRDAVAYETGTTHSGTTAEHAPVDGVGVCQDHAHILLSAARQLGFPARYVSGYLMMDDRVHQEASHAWAEMWIEQLGWLAFDVSNGISPDERYVRVATGLDYRDVAPITGVRHGQSEEHLQVVIQVQQ